MIFLWMSLPLWFFILALGPGPNNRGYIIARTSPEQHACGTTEGHPDNCESGKPSKLSQPRLPSQPGELSQPSQPSQPSQLNQPSQASQPSQQPAHEPAKQRSWHRAKELICVWLRVHWTPAVLRAATIRLAGWVAGHKIPCHRIPKFADECLESVNECL